MSGVQVTQFSGGLEQKNGYILKNKIKLKSTSETDPTGENS